jgi:hypothetical protein
MVSEKKIEEPTDDLQKQHEYVEKQKSKKNAGMGIVFADAFLRGIRNLGYKSPATAINELIDNGYQASATIVDVMFSFDNKSKSKPSMIAIADNGHGMVPGMLYFAVKWGGTHRENDRTGFGRFGYGLPSAAVSVTKRYTVYSKVSGKPWHAITVDLDELCQQAEGDQPVDVPQAEEAELPDFVLSSSKLDAAQMDSGTIIVMEDLDGLAKKSGWVATKTLKEKLLKQFGVVYRHIIPELRLFVDGDEVVGVDPLFLKENCRFYDENSVHAQAVEMMDFDVKNSDGKTGRVRIRASYMPPNFTWKNPSVYKKGNENNRFPILKEYNGFLVCRAGRQIDCLGIIPWGTFVNYDRYMKIEIDFDPELDEFFSITTSKQQVGIEDSMWSRLDSAGVRTLFNDLRKKCGETRSKVKAEQNAPQDENKQRASEKAMETSQRMNPQPKLPSPQKQEQAEKRLKIEASQEAEQKGKPLEEVVEQKKEQAMARPYKIEFPSIPDGPFYRTERLGIQKRLFINSQHPFFTHLYDAPGSTAEIKAALEILLFVLADAELDAEGDFETFYKSARINWSERLRNALLELDKDDSITDKASALQEEFEVSVSKSD